MTKNLMQILALVIFTVTFSAQADELKFAHNLIPDFLPESALPFPKKDLMQFEALANPVRWEDIRGWRPLGYRYAAALSQQGAVLAIYDLSVQESIITAERTHLGTIGDATFRLKAVRDVLIETQARDDLTASERKKLNKAVKKLSRVQGTRLSDNLFTPDWYVTVPWTLAARQRFIAAGIADLAGSPVKAPPQFALADIDYSSVATSPLLFNKSLKYLTRFNLDLSRIVFVQRTDGGYEFYALGTGPSEAHPLKVADLESPHTAFWRSIELTIGTSVLGFAVGLIPVPIVSAILSTGLNRFITYKRDVIALHREAAAEMVRAAEVGGGPFSAFDSLTNQERENTGISLYLEQASLFTVWNWIFKGAARAWRADLVVQDGRAVKAAAWLTKHNEDFITLDSRYALSFENTARRRLYLLPHVRTFDSLRPAHAIDYDHPYRHLSTRIAIESASIVVNFASHFIPWVGGIISSAFTLAVRNPIQYSKEWEARLTGHLEERQRVAHEDWSYELTVLDRQRVSPFELSREEAAELIVTQRRRLGMLGAY